MNKFLVLTFVVLVPALLLSAFIPAAAQVPPPGQCPMDEITRSYVQACKIFFPDIDYEITVITIPSLGKRCLETPNGKLMCFRY